LLLESDASVFKGASKEDSILYDVFRLFNVTGMAGEFDASGAGMFPDRQPR
jgi:hypothetical protein